MSDLLASPSEVELDSRPVGRVSRPVPSDEMGHQTHPTRYHLIWLALSAGVMVLAAILTVREQTQVLIPLTSIPLPELCMARRWFDLGCPGCGMTRCFIALAHGDLAAAWSYNPAGLLLFAVVAFQVPFRAVQLWRIRRGQPELAWSYVPQVILGGIAAFMIAQWLLRLCGVQW